jgi:hypothetical protein
MEDVTVVGVVLIAGVSRGVGVAICAHKNVMLHASSQQEAILNVMRNV